MESLKKHEPSITKIVPWDEIEDFYNNLISNNWELEGMVSLVQFIRNSGLDKRIFAYTSLDKLIITIYNPAEWHRESLQIQLNNANKKFHFEYFPKPFEKSELERDCSADQIVTKFSQYIKWLKW